jgi:hypothetical protein
MVERGQCHGGAVADRPSATSNSGGEPTRELAQRLSGGVEVLLLWHPEIDLVELSLHDIATGVEFQIEVAPGDANDAFHHPYAYVAKRDPWPSIADG